MEVIGRCEIRINPVRPLLLQGNAEDGYPARMTAHHLEEIVNVGSFLNVVGQTEMGIVEFILTGL